MASDQSPRTVNFEQGKKPGTLQTSISNEPEEWNEETDFFILIVGLVPQGDNKVEIITKPHDPERSSQREDWEPPCISISASSKYRFSASALRSYLATVSSKMDT